MQRTSILFLFLLILSHAYPSDSSSVKGDSSLLVQKIKTDSLVSGQSNKHIPAFVKESIVPLSLAATGLTIMCIPNLKQNIQTRLNWNREEKVYLLDDELRFLPTATMALMSAFKAEGKHKFWEQLILCSSTYALSDFFVYRLKTTTRIQRPYPHIENESFPSQHTAMAFLAASMLQKEFGEKYPVIGIGGYAVASWVGYARIARNRHFLPDVLVGASIGMLSANLTYWVYDKLNQKLKHNIQCQSFIGKNQVGIQILCTL